MAIRNILSSKMRTFLTMLGIIIGIASVMVIVGLGNGMQNYMLEMFQSMGTNTLTVSLYGRGSNRAVDEEEMYEIVAENSQYLSQVSPTVSVQGTVKIGTETSDYTSVTGVSEDYFNMMEYAISQGRGLQYIDVEKRLNVCVVGEYINQTYYNGDGCGADHPSWLTIPTRSWGSWPRRATRWRSGPPTTASFSPTPLPPAFPAEASPAIW